MRLKLIVATLGIAMVALSAVSVGCGSDDQTTSTSVAAEADEATASDEATEEDEGSAVTTAPAGGGQTVTIEMGEFYFKPADAQAKAGTVTIDAPNAGNAPHELVLAKTDDDPTKLPTAADGSVDEAALDVPGEVAEVEAGADGTVTLDLEAGKYAMFCNLPGHYKSGMYGSLTVK